MDALEVVRREGDVFYRQAATADPELGVPNCPGWVVGDLVWHLGEVHWFWSEIIETRASSPDAIGGAHPSRPGEYADLV
ncbi:MAG TPA: maleylpyruvate isomerase N-terminal domain-containing protein, partial [Acidimicrobiales bacterium]|nr:maleylpyruvate isomerase N-terminal domain-containing protein [Acidimicrobiales bacterium]